MAENKMETGSVSKDHLGGTLGKVVLYLFLIGFAILFIFPFLWMVSTSLKELKEALSINLNLIPTKIHWDNYLKATREIPFWNYLLNTIFLCTMNVIGTTLSCSFVAYGFSRIEWKGRDKFFAITLATMMIPFPVLMVPLYKIFLSLDWIGTYKPLWVPAFLGSAYNIFLLRQFFLRLPKELTEAAMIDGCSHIRIFFQIILPLSIPSLLVVALFNFMYVWNDFMGPLIYLTEQKDFTLALGLQSFQSKLGGVEINYLMAAATLMVMPIVILYFFTQKTFIEGISMSGIKG